MDGQNGKLLLCISVGALSASIWPQWFYLLAGLLLLISLLAPVFFRLAVVIRYYFFLLALLGGALWVSGHWFWAQAQAMSVEQPPFQATIVGKVTDVQGFQDSLTLGLQVASFESVAGSSQVAKQLSGSRIQVKCFRCKVPISVGEIWQMQLKLRPFVSFQNPGALDYRRWMVSQGYSAGAYVPDKFVSHMVRLQAPSKLQSQLNHWRARVAVALQGVPGERFLLALVLGQKHHMFADEKRLLTTTGLGHLFVISGLHIGLVAGLFFMLSRLLSRPLLLLGLSHLRTISWLAALLGALSYALVSGFQVPAMRATLMFFMVGLLLLSGRLNSPFNVLMWALVIVLVLEPLAFMGMGAWLSFGIVAALIWGFWRRAVLPPFSYFKGLVRAQFYAFCAGAVVLVGHGAVLSMSGIVLNLILIPVFGLLILPLAVLGVLVALVNGNTEVLSWSGGLLLWIFEALAQGSNVLSLNSSWSVPASHRALLMLGLVMLMLPLGLYVRGLGLLVICLMAWVPAEPIEQGVVHIRVLDVGQGSSALIQTRDHSMLVDTGRGFASGFTLVDFVVAPFLRHQGVRYLDKVLLSHDDLDHSGGLQVLQKWGPPMGEVIQQAECLEQQWIWNEVQFEQFQAKGFKEGNNGSCLLLVSAAGQSMLFAGDIEASAEYQLLGQRPELRADVLLVPHHGSRTSSTEAWISRIQPSWAIVSAGRFNQYGHPHPQVVSRYVDRNVALLGTYSHGAIEVVLGAGQMGLKVSTYAP